MSVSRRRSVRSRGLTGASAGLLVSLALTAALVLAPARTWAWEPDTTHAGLTEQAAMSSRLHQRLRSQLGVSDGLFAALIIPPADAPALFETLGGFNPTHGYVPDTRGRMLALGWLAAGSVLADVPVEQAANHFFDPLTGRGLDDDSIRGLSDRLRHRIYPRLAGEPLPREGVPAVAWVVDPSNPMGLNGFIGQYQKAVSAATPGERARHLAGALLAAGAILHVLQDMGSPSHVRDDLAAHLQPLGPDAFDMGSRFERVAALTHGRLGVPAPGRAVHAATLRAFFTTAAPAAGAAAPAAGAAAPAAGAGSDASAGDQPPGLADLTAGRWFSPSTLPRPIRIHPGLGQSRIGMLLTESLVRPRPAPLPRLDMNAARRGSARLSDERGVCLANYRLQDDGMLVWFIDDACMTEQVAAILPEVAAYSAGLLDWLFRGNIALDLSGPAGGQPGARSVAARAGGIALGAGTVTFFWDDQRGVRTPLGAPVAVSGPVAADAVLARAPALPAEARAVAVLFQGKDAAGEPVVAAGYASVSK